MIRDVEISSFDLRYQGCRMKHDGAEKILLRSILECGISLSPLKVLTPKMAEYCLMDSNAAGVLRS
ncbi:MAG: hypothetical protein QME49_10195 [bacterium]|nr:hypothetical protein [bacterium]